MVFNFFQPPQFVNDHKEYKNLPQSYSICLRSQSLKMVGVGSRKFMAIRFRAGAFRHFCNIPFGEVHDSILEIEDLWGSLGHEVCQQMLEVRSWEKCIQILEAFLIKCFLRHQKMGQEAMDDAINTLYYQYNKVKGQEIAQGMNISYRHFQRGFKQAFGVSPKFFQQIARFQSTIKYLMLHKEEHYLECALTNGYYDQSHFIKDCQRFIGVKPMDFLTNHNFMTHFYNPSSHL